MKGVESTLSFKRRKMKIAVIQLNSINDKKRNLEKIREFFASAKKGNCNVVALPEVFNCRCSLEDMPKYLEDFNTSPSIKALQGMAQEFNFWILAGSLLLREDSAELPFNTSFVISPEGKLESKYSKIHLFKVQLDNKKIDETERSQAGLKPVIAKLPEEIKLGMSICYDLRFPELYRIYSQEKVEILYVPSAFTKKTGEAHWEVLLRARAIENQAFVIAPNQCGEANGVENYGHSMIIDPWGNVLARASGDNEEVIYAEIDLDLLKNIRANIPALEHRKIY